MTWQQMIAKADEFAELASTTHFDEAERLILVKLANYWRKRANKKRQLG